MKEITKSLSNFVNQELTNLMAEFNSYRNKLAKIGQDGTNIKTALEKEVYFENKIRSMKALLKEKIVIVPVKQNKIINIGSRFTACINGENKKFIIDGVGYPLKTEPVIIGCETDLGSRVLGKKVGDDINIGALKVKVVEINDPW